MTAKIILLGSKGIVGSEILKMLKDKYKVYAFSHKDLDITDINLLSDTVNKIRPQYLINAAAYTKVEDAEHNNRLCYEVNSNAVYNIATICKTCDTHLIHFSTDYVYNGEKKEPYIESDKASPLNTYGDSKNRADQFIMTSECQYTIFRTSWVYGTEGYNFVKSILSKAINQNELTVVSDQYGTPTSSLLIAQVINIFLLDLTKKTKDIKRNQVFNLCPSGFTTWYGFACSIIKQASKIDTKYDIEVKPTTSSNYSSSVKRPSYTVLSNKKICSYFDIDIQNWEYYLIRFLEKNIQ